MSTEASLANLADALEGFEARPGQRRMAQAVEQAVLAGRDLVPWKLAPAPAKPSSYLTPAAHLNKRVLVSTATKQLQSQILGHDLPQSPKRRRVAIALWRCSRAGPTTSACTGWGWCRAGPAPAADFTDGKCCD